MAPGARVRAAFQAMKDIGIPENKTKPALKKLLKLFDKKWDLIEEENYRVLADTIFEYEETEAAEKEVKKTAPNADRGEVLEEEAATQDEPERPLKRLRLKHQGQAASSLGQPSPSSGAFALKIPKPEPGEPEASPCQYAPPISGSPQSNAGSRRSQPVSPQPLIRNKGKQPISSQNVGAITDGLPAVNGRDRMKEPLPQTTRREKRAAPERSQALQLKEPKLEPGIAPTAVQKQPDTFALIKPKDEPFTDDMLTLEPLAVVLPERSPSKSSDPVDRQAGQLHANSKSVDGTNKGVGTLASASAEENNLQHGDVPEKTAANIVLAASPLGEVKISLSCNRGPKGHGFHEPDLQVALEKMNDNCFRTYKIVDPQFSITKLMGQLCEYVLYVGTDGNGVMQERSCSPEARVVDNCGASPLNGSNAESSDNVAAPIDKTVTNDFNPPSAPNIPQMGMKSIGNAIDKHCAERDSSSVEDTNTKSLVIIQHQPQDNIMCVYDMNDITRGEEKVLVSLEKSNSEFLPSFHYIGQNVVSQNADVRFSLAEIGDGESCASCHGDCLSLSSPCNCAQRNGESPYTSDGLVREDFLEECISMVRNPHKDYLVYCKECPLERSKNEDMLDPCKGHLKRRFIKECWTKCGCSKYCGNRVVQRGIRSNLQVFWTPEGKGWGLRTLEDLPKGAFVCEYVGEILTNTELHKRNLRRNNDKNSYSVLLDTDWGSRDLKEDKVLCLDATFYGNVARFINHRCTDANLIEIPVEVETPSHHYYHVALFTTRKIDALEELTWDYGVDFDDNEHHIKAFRCLCGSNFCRNMKRSSRSRSSLTLR